jgi:hypothetical protein
MLIEKKYTLKNKKKGIFIVSKRVLPDTTGGLNFALRITYKPKM